MPLKRIISYSIAAVLLLFLTSCARVDPIIKIGLVAPFEGAEREIGYDVIYSARLAVREINAAGGIGGYRVALVALDDSGVAEQAVDAAVSLTLDPAVVAVVGHWLPETTAVAAPIYEAANLFFLPGGTAPWDLADPADYTIEFQQNYEAVTPFDETAGPYAGAAYAAMEAIFQQAARAAAAGPITRESMSQTDNP